ncbi:MAG: NUDIX hydrolase [Candidatus Saccharimonadaceae bacterium]
MKTFSGVKIALVCDGKIIIIQRDDKPGLRFAGMWDLPGGGREDDETPIQTVQREVFEELHLSLSENSILYQREYPAMVEKNVAAYFMAGLVTKEQVNSIIFGDEGQGWKLVTIKEFLDDKNIVPFLRGRLDDLINHPDSKRLNLI